MRGSREILRDSETKLLTTIRGINSDVSELLLLAEKVLTSAKSMERETSSVADQVRSQVEGGRRKAKLALSGRREEIAREALRHSIALELESEKTAAHATRLLLLTAELSKWKQDLKEMHENLASWSKLWTEQRGRAVILPSLTLLGRIIRRMIRATSVIDKVNQIVDTLKVDIEGLERLRAEAEPRGEAFGWKYKMSADLKSKLDARLSEEMSKLTVGH